MGNGDDFGLKHLNYAYQKGEGGIADALSLAQNFVGDEKICVVLGDNIVQGNIVNAVNEFREQESGAKILLKMVSDAERFGVAEIIDSKVVNIVEKPKIPPSNLAVTGIYFYDSSAVSYTHLTLPTILRV